MDEGHFKPKVSKTNDYYETLIIISFFIYFLQSISCSSSVGG